MGAALAVGACLLWVQAGCAPKAPAARPPVTRTASLESPPPSPRPPKRRSWLRRIGDAARRLVGRTIAKVMGKTHKVSDPRWRGEYCTRDAYFSRFRHDLGHDGIANFGVVQPGVLYRGSQPFIDGEPDAQGRRGNGFDTLAQRGIKCRILLRTTTRTDNLLSERKELRRRGIRLFHLPISNFKYGLPTDRVFGVPIPDSARGAYTRAMTRARDRFMEIVTSHKYGPCYLSCQSGKDRTGVLIGWYRAVVQGWKPARVLREMQDCKYEPKGHFGYFQRVFCRWYEKRFGRDATCGRVLGR